MFRVSFTIAVVHEGEATGLHVHAYNFARDARSYLDESHVVRKRFTA